MISCCINKIFAVKLKERVFCTSTTCIDAIFFKYFTDLLQGFMWKIRFAQHVLPVVLVQHCTSTVPVTVPLQYLYTGTLHNLYKVEPLHSARRPEARILLSELLLQVEHNVYSNRESYMISMSCKEPGAIIIYIILNNVKDDVYERKSDG